MAHDRDRLSDPDYAAFAWARFRRMMRWNALAALVAVAAAFAYLIAIGSELRIHMLIATAVGVGATVLLAGALMGLVFLSSGTGHDQDAQGREDGWR